MYLSNRSGLNGATTAPDRSHQPRRTPFRNRVLALLPASSLAHLAPHLEPVSIRARQTLAEAGLPVRAAHFIERGAACLLSRKVGAQAPMELGIIGRSGFVGLPIVLGDGRQPYQCVVQIPGRALRIEAGALRDAYERDPALRRAMNCHALARLVEQAQLGVCNSRHTVEQRICRWLLLAGDHVDGASVPATHDLIARMLGARRAGVTVALGGLERAGVLRKGRGRIEILDEEALSAVACDCHRLIRAEGERLFTSLAATRGGTADCVRLPL